MLKQIDFVTGAVRAAIAATKDGNSLSFCQEFLGEPEDHRRFAGAAYGKISNADHCCFQSLLFKFTCGIEPAPGNDISAVNLREGPEKEAQGEGQLHCAWRGSS